MNTYRCIFCWLEIKPKLKHKLDPCALVLMSSTDEAKANRKEQEFYCHLDCFKNVTDSQNIYILEDDAATAGEIEAESECFKKGMDVLAELIVEHENDATLQKMLRSSGAGEWQRIVDVFPVGQAIRVHVEAHEDQLGSDLLIAWTTDFYQGLRETSRTCVVIIAADDYGETRSVIINRQR